MGGYHDSNGKWRDTETKRMLLPLGSFSGSAAAVPIFTSEAAASFGFSVDNSEAFGIRWNNHAAPNAIFTSFISPTDRQPGTDITVKCRASKSGATLADAVTFTIGAFNNAVGALHDADATFGGDTDAMVGDAAAKTVQEVSATLASADLVDGAIVTLSIKPTDDLLDTDDVTLHAIFLEYEGHVSGS